MVVAVVAILLVLLSFMLLRGTRNFLGLEMSMLGWIVRIFIILLAGAAVYVTKRQNNNVVYSFEGNKLTVTNRSAFGGSGNQQIITIDPKSVTSVNLSQSSMDKRLNAGTISITVDTMGSSNVYKLEKIENPELVLQQIQNYLT